MPITLEEQSGDWKDKFAELCSKSHTDQAKWFLNGFWEDFQEEGAQKIWDITHKFMEIQLGFPVLYGGKMRAFEEGCDLDELQSHRVLEEFGNTMTVIELRRRLKNLDIDNNKRMALTEYLLDLYRKSPKDVVNAPQGNVDPVELKAAENAFQTASEKLEQSQADARVAQEVLEEAKNKAASASADLLVSTRCAAEAASALKVSQEAQKQSAEALELATKAATKAKEDKSTADEAAQVSAVSLEKSTKSALSAAQAKEESDEKARHATHCLDQVSAAEAKVRQAEKELQSAVDSLEAEEKAHADKIEKLQAIVDSPTASTVKKGGAKNEMEQLKCQDSLPLQRSKITQKAALKKVEKQRKLAAECTQEAKQVKAVADEAFMAASAAKEQADENAEQAKLAKSAADETANAALRSLKEAENAQEKSCAAKIQCDEKMAASEVCKLQADEAASASEASQVAAEEAEAKSAEKKKEADFAADEAQKAVALAEEKLSIMKQGTGTPNGDIYWMEKTLIEKRKFMR